MKGENIMSGKGSKTVDAIKTPEDIQKIKDNLQHHLRDLTLFCISVNNGLRMKDILLLTVGQVNKLKVGERLWITETKRKKRVQFVLDNDSHRVLHHYLDYYKLTDSDPLFPQLRNQRTKSRYVLQYPLKAITSAQASRLIKRWCSEAKLDGLYGCHTPRKTWGYLMRKYLGLDWALICDRYGHANMEVTKTYLGITDTEITDILKISVTDKGFGKK